MCICNIMEHGGGLTKVRRKCSQCISWKTDSLLVCPVCDFCLSQKLLSEVIWLRVDKRSKQLALLHYEFGRHLLLIQEEKTEYKNPCRNIFRVK